MAEIVTGTPSIVGFTSGYGDHYNHYNQGWNGKDTIRFEAEHLRDAICSNAVAIEKTGAANSLATEKIGAAMGLAVEKVGAANTIATNSAAHSAALQMCELKTTLLNEMKDCCCEIRKEVADVKATVLEVDARNVRDDLAATRAELLALRTADRGHGEG